MAKLKELQEAYRKVIEAGNAFEPTSVTVDKRVFEQPEVEAPKILWEEWQKAKKELEDVWLR